MFLPMSVNIWYSNTLFYLIIFHLFSVISDFFSFVARIGFHLYFNFSFWIYSSYWGLHLIALNFCRLQTSSINKLSKSTLLNFDKDHLSKPWRFTPYLNLLLKYSLLRLMVAKLLSLCAFLETCFVITPCISKGIRSLYIENYFGKIPLRVFVTHTT